MRTSTLGFTLIAALSLPSSARAAWETKQIAGMSVEVYTPASQSPIGEGRALMLGLHGCAQTGANLRQYGAFEQTAEDFGMVLALPTVPGGGVIAGCWDYYGPTHDRTSGHNAPLLELTQTLRDDPSYGIDPAQVYLTGFSSGGGQALIVGCLAPELFAGLAISAGPSLGTTVAQIAQVGTTVEQTVALCQQFAGEHVGDFATQVAITFTDTQDFTVAQGYAQINADMFATLYGGDLTTGALDVATLPGTNPAGTGVRYDDAQGERIAFVTSMGVGHNWPAGSGMGGGAVYVANTGLDLAAFAATTFTANNRRASGEWGPGDEGGDESGSGEGGGAGTGGDSAGDGGSSEDGGSGESAGGNSGASTLTVGIDDDGHIEPSGCQCRADTRDRSGATAWLALAIAAMRRRPRRPGR
jgi:poly(3-hydroxybutyrate) depolymerase